MDKNCLGSAWNLYGYGDDAQAARTGKVSDQDDPRHKISSSYYTNLTGNKADEDYSF